jgi:phage terminase small subunit
LVTRRTIESRARDIEEASGRKLTQRQKEFARIFVDGRHSNAECARQAGYAADSANVQASVLLKGERFPHLIEYINELREDRERRFGVTLIGQMERFDRLSRGAEEASQFSAAVNAEKIRSALGGLTIDRREQNHLHSIEGLSREAVEKRLSELRNSHPEAFIEGKYEEIDDEPARSLTVDEPEGVATEPLAISAD